MKTLMLASIIALSSSAAMAGSFDFERQFGTTELFPSLVLEQSTDSNAGSPSFAYERAIGAPELFPTLVTEAPADHVPLGQTVVDRASVNDSIWGWNFPVGG